MRSYCGHSIAGGREDCVDNVPAVSSLTVPSTMARRRSIPISESAQVSAAEADRSGSGPVGLGPVGLGPVGLSPVGLSPVPQEPSRRKTARQKAA